MSDYDIQAYLKFAIRAICACALARIGPDVMRAKDHITLFQDLPQEIHR
jgi:hypothetical protein